MRFWGPLSFVALCLFSLPAVAQDIGLTAPGFGLSEIRGGAALTGLELISHTYIVPEPSSFGNARFDGAQFDLLFKSPDIDVFKWLGSPRPSIGGLVSLSGHESFVHAGLDWHVPLGSSKFYVEGGIGVGFHNGYLEGAPPGYRNLGCGTLFHWDYGVGMNLTDQITLTAEWQHMSNVNQCTYNDGLNDFGIVVGWKF
jgi:lipid A 3-O-deacylase